MRTKILVDTGTWQIIHVDDSPAGSYGYASAVRVLPVNRAENADAPEAKAITIAEFDTCQPSEAEMRRALRDANVELRKAATREIKKLLRVIKILQGVA